MKKVNLINIDTNEILLTYQTNKKSYNTIQSELINKSHELFKNRLWIQGKISFINKEKNNCLLGGSLWWIVAGVNGRLQFQIMEQLKDICK